MADFFQSQVNAAREAVAAGINCDVSAFDGNTLTVVDRPDQAWYTVLMVTFGTGTVLSLDPAYRAFVEDDFIRKHYFAMRPQYLELITEEGMSRGESLEYGSASLCFVLHEEPSQWQPPDGFTLTREEASWMNDPENGRRFENGAGEPGVGGRAFRNRYALVLRDTNGGIAAVAGAFDTFGMLEIGIDVEREHRGRGFARLAVSALARTIFDEGKTPLYACSPTNIRSQRTAAAAGFRIAFSDAFVWKKEGH